MPLGNFVFHLLLFYFTRPVRRRCCLLPDAGPDTSRLFRRAGEGQSLWEILERDNPWEISGKKDRHARWIKATERVKRVGHVKVSDKRLTRRVQVNVCKGLVSLGDVGVLQVCGLLLCSQTNYINKPSLDTPDYTG